MQKKTQANFCMKTRLDGGVKNKHTLHHDKTRSWFKCDIIQHGNVNNRHTEKKAQHEREATPYKPLGTWRRRTFPSIGFISVWLLGQLLESEVVCFPSKEAEPSLNFQAANSLRDLTAPILAERVSLSLPMQSQENDQTHVFSHPSDLKDIFRHFGKSTYLTSCQRAEALGYVWTDHVFVGHQRDGEDTVLLKYRKPVHSCRQSLQEDIQTVALGCHEWKMRAGEQEFLKLHPTQEKTSLKTDAPDRRLHNADIWVKRERWKAEISGLWTTSLYIWIWIYSQFLCKLQGSPAEFDHKNKKMQILIKRNTQPLKQRKVNNWNLTS